MKCRILIALLLCLASCRKDLLHWQRLQRLETHTATDRLNKVLFLTDSIGFVVGGQRFSNSTILTTRDGGNTWQYDDHPEAGKGLYSIAKTPGGDVCVIGFDGKLLRTSDSGKNWGFKQLFYLPYKDLAFFDAEHALAVGGVSFNQGFRTRFDLSGGMQPYDSSGYELNDIEMVDGRTGYLSGHGVVLRTSDSGKTWRILSPQDDNFTAIHAYGNLEAWTCGYNGSIFHTTDGGETWSRERNGNELAQPRYHLLDILFNGPSAGYAVGEDGLVIYTDDGGHHWIEFDRFTDATLRCIIKMKDGSLMICGDKGSLYRLLPNGF